MAVVVFDFQIDEETLACIQELRLLRLEVLKKQVNEIDKVIETLAHQGALEAHEKHSLKPVIIEDLKEKCAELEARMQTPETVFMDELELYIDVLKSKAIS